MECTFFYVSTSKNESQRKRKNKHKWKTDSYICKQNVFRTILERNNFVQLHAIFRIVVENKCDEKEKERNERKKTWAIKFL